MPLPVVYTQVWSTHFPFGVTQQQHLQKSECRNTTKPETPSAKTARSKKDRLVMALDISAYLLPLQLFNVETSQLETV